MTEKTGFAPAAAPHASTIVSTSEEAITAGETSIPSQGENMPAYHARPKSADGPLPIVIVVQEIFGVHEHIRDLCRRLALEGRSRPRRQLGGAQRGRSPSSAGHRFLLGRTHQLAVCRA